MYYRHRHETTATAASVHGVVAVNGSSVVGAGLDIVAQVCDNY